MTSIAAIAKQSAGRPPLVSVVIPSCNHARYLEKAIASVLSQDYADFELLISDDASHDGSWEIIRRCDDHRVRIFQQQKNLGPVGNLVFLLKQSRCKYIALLNSDDYWLPRKLGKQVAILEAAPELGACFTWADLVDKSGRRVTGDEELWNDVFRQPNRTQAAWLRYFFFNGNCICHPSMLIRREVYEHVGFYSPGLRQLPDFEMWIRLVKRYPIHIVEESLVGHVRSGENFSALTAETTARNLNELIEIFDGFFADIPDELFTAGFSEHFRLKDVPMMAERLHCEKLFLLLQGGFAPSSARIAALRGFGQSFRRPALERVLLLDYGFSIFDYYKLSGTSGFGHYWMLAMDRIKPTRLELSHAARLHWRENPLYRYLKTMARFLRLIPRSK